MIKILYDLSRVKKSRECKDLIERFLKRDIFKRILRIPVEEANRSIIMKGAERIKEEILSELKGSNVDKHHAIIDFYESASPAPPSVTPDQLKSLQFYDEDTKNLFHLVKKN